MKEVKTMKKGTTIKVIGNVEHEWAVDNTLSEVVPIKHHVTIGTLGTFIGWDSVAEKRAGDDGAPYIFWNQRGVLLCKSNEGTMFLIKKENVIAQ